MTFSLPPASLNHPLTARMPLNVEQGLFILHTLLLSLAQWEGICVFINMTVASNCEQPSSSTLGFLLELPLSTPCLLSVPDI